MDLVIVESPAKAKTINKYLGKDYTVLASYGHVRDLSPKEGSVQPDDDFAMAWQVDDRSEKQLKEIIKALRGADTLYLATDPDREGEAISWHIEEILRERELLKNVEVKRVVFNEITADAVRNAFTQPREVNQELVDAYLARRALDYLVGFTLSPVLWRKLPGARSAGRVQSVALRLICEREAEIEIFRPQEYWSVEVALTTPKGDPFTARLSHLDGKKLGKFDLGNEAAAAKAKTTIEGQAFAIADVERKRTRRNPQPPFTTSTLQQEASRKLGFSATQTMRVAQRLYEGVDVGGETAGVITYMRTDSVTLSNDAINGCRAVIDQDYGTDYLPAKPRVYKTKAKNAQEAHEAIRPTDLARRPRDAAKHLNKDEQRLYELIWRRTVAAEMAEAQLDQVVVDIAGADQATRLRANGSTIAFDGFLKVYKEDRDDAPQNGDAADPDAERRLPPMDAGDKPNRGPVTPNQHFTQPPPRFSEASLVKRLEELGIGRPSTYASILQVLQDRDYVRLDKRRFIPEDKGRIVTTFLTSFFERYVQYDFTARLEEQLDEISDGRIDWRQVLRDFWEAFATAAEDTKALRTRVVLDVLDEELGPHFFPAENGKNPRACPACADGRIGLRVGRHGPFIGCSNYPECKYTRRLSVPGGDGDDAELAAGPKELGTDPATGLMVTVRKGPYGVYLQLGEPEGDTKPKRCAIPKGMSASDIALETALQFLALPRDIAPHPEDGVMIQAGIGRFGPYVKHGRTYVSLPEPGEVLTVGVNRAVTLIAEKGKNRRGATPLRELGEHPDDKKPVDVFEGRYGPYVKHGKINATIPDGRDPAEITLAEAVELIAARAAKAGAKKKPAAKKKATPKKTTAKKAPAKKPTTKKPTTKSAANGAKKPAAKKPAAKKTTARKKAAAPSAAAD